MELILQKITGLIQRNGGISSLQLHTLFGSRYNCPSFVLILFGEFVITSLIFHIKIIR